MAEYRFIEPLDVLYLRGNKLFGDAGSHGEALMPPWPSLAAGALRSRMLADHKVNFTTFANGAAKLESALAVCLGTPADPGAFRIATFTLAQRRNGEIKPCFPVPADVVILGRDNTQRCHYLHPCALSPSLRSSYPLPELPVLATGELAKPEGSYWLNGAGLAAYLAGKPLTADHLIKTKKLWQLDPRLGITLNSQSRTAAESMIYTVETVALCENVGFLVEIQGADGVLPNNGFLRFGGDGRAAQLESTPITFKWPEPDWERIAADRRFRLILATPGLFADGWQLPGLNKEYKWHWPGGSAQLVAASVNRAEVVSGWDLAKWQPKAAQRIAPAGSVYWFRKWSGNVATLQELTLRGLTDGLEPNRCAEGFNNVLIAAWPQPN